MSLVKTTCVSFTLIQSQSALFPLITWQSKEALQRACHPVHTTISCGTFPFLSPGVDCGPFWACAVTKPKVAIVRNTIDFRNNLPTLFICLTPLGSSLVAGVEMQSQL
jgi:hypothetical protein